MSSSNFSETVFLSALGERCQRCLPKAYAVLDSTNTELCRLAREGAPEGTVIFADEQQKGRGRRGHTFFSPLSGLYMSLLLRPQAEVSPLHITTAAAVAVAEAIEQLTGIPAGIKWVNDIYCNGKKVAGILTEGAFFPHSAALQYAVLGIGVNLTSPPNGFPSDIKDRAGSLFDNKKPPAFLKEKLAAAIMINFWQWYERLARKEFLEEYRRRSLLTGKTVRVLTVEGEVSETAVVTGISDAFALQITTKDGTKKELSSGEVSVTAV